MDLRELTTDELHELYGMILVELSRRSKRNISFNPVVDGDNGGKESEPLETEGGA